MKRIVFDLDGTLCDEQETFQRSLAEPRKEMIDLVNKCHEEGIFIMIYTARSWMEYKMTEDWLQKNNVSYDTLICGKPVYDLWIDDRCLNPREQFEKIKSILGG